MQTVGAFTRVRRSLFGSVGLLVVLITAALPGRAFAGNPAKTGYPNSIASTGDSITRAFETGVLPFTDNPFDSWSTGGNDHNYSHYTHILVANPKIKDNNSNDAKTGAMMADLNGQVTSAVSQHVDYVTILMGGNDVCTNTPDTMTSIADYRTQFTTAMNTLSSGLPDARIFVVSIPDVYQLWVDFHTNTSARFKWNFATICQSMLVNPLSMAAADVSRRAFVRQRNIDLNTQLQQVCTQYIHCRFDQNKLFNTHFAPSEISARDYFHPNKAGQMVLGNRSYAVTFNFTDTIAPVSRAMTTPVSGGISVSITATDNVGVQGIEWRIGTSGYTHYTGPVTVASGNPLYFRAVDVNGNIEAEQAVTAP